MAGAAGHSGEKAIRVLVTGSRAWTDVQAVRDALTAIEAEHRDADRWVLVHGACPTGADAHADRYASTEPGWEIARYPADWRRHGRQAGPIRNAHMVAQGADVALAFIRDRSPGATGCARLAEQAGIEVRRWTS